MPDGTYKSATRHRQLLRTLGNDVTAVVLDRLERSPCTVADLQSEGISRAHAKQTLSVLLAYELVDYEVVRGQSGGRPARLWRIAAPKRLTDFKKALERLCA